jgi:hypothetical protein
VRKGGALVQSSQVYEMHTKRLMAFEKRGQNDITQPLLPLYSCAISRQIALTRDKVNSSNMPPRAIISSLSNFVFPLSFPNHTSGSSGGSSSHLSTPSGISTTALLHQICDTPPGTPFPVIISFVSPTRQPPFRLRIFSPSVLCTSLDPQFLQK